MKKTLAVAILLLLACTFSAAQVAAQPQTNLDITGMYSFLHEGEFVQIEVSDGHVTGVVSHFRDEDVEKAEFVDQFIEKASLDGSHLSFSTKVSCGTWYEFSGTVERGTAKSLAEEGYWILRGTVTISQKTDDGTPSEKKHEVTMKSFPQEPEPGSELPARPNADTTQPQPSTTPVSSVPAENTPVSSVPSAGK